MDVMKIIWISLAVKQRNLIFNYWNNRNKSNLYSRKLNLKIKQIIHQLIDNPELGKKISLKNYRAVVLNQYSIIYQIKEQKIYIMSIWDNRQNPNKLLKLLKEKK